MHDDDGGHLRDIPGLDCRALFEAIPHPTVILDADHRVMAANRATRELVGAAERSLVGERCWEVFHEPGRVGPSSTCVMQQAIEAGLAAEAVGEVHFEALDRHVRVSCTAVSDDGGELSHVVHMATDISDHKRSEAAARESERLFRTLFDKAGDYMLVVDPTCPDGPTIIDANQSACERHGYGRDELIGMRMIELEAPETRQHVPAWAKRIMAGEDFVFETVHARKDGSRFPVEVAAKLISVGGQPRIFAIERDITARKQAEQEREHLQGQLLQAQKLESLGVLAGGIAHDFNNLLTSMLGNADLLLTALSDDAKLGPRVQGIATSAERAAEIVRQMLSYAGHAPCEPEPLDLLELVEEMSRLLEAGLSKSVRLELSSEPELPAIDGDAGRLGQVVMNLITNAAEALGEPGGEIRIRLGIRQCDGAFLRQTYLGENLRAGRYVFVEVSDDGPGMDERVQERIFDPFFSTKTDGHGLGLAAVLGIVRSHHGAVQIRSESGQGTSFEVLFPALERRSSKPAPATDNLSSWGRGRQIMLVDDEAAVRKVTRTMLEGIGFQVTAVASGEAAIVAFRREPERFVAVLLDASMPGIGGPECYHKLRSCRADVPVLVMSGHDADYVRRRFVGVRDVLSKPFRFAELSRRLRKELDTPGS